jgi:hypothetical protein
MKIGLWKTGMSAPDISVFLINQGKKLKPSGGQPVWDDRLEMVALGIPTRIFQSPPCLSTYDSIRFQGKALFIDVLQLKHVYIFMGDVLEFVSGRNYRSNYLNGGAS